MNRGQMSDELVACIRCSMFSTNKRQSIRIGMQIIGQLVADTMCSDMEVSNQILVTRINGRCKGLSLEQINMFSCQSLFSLQTIHYQPVFVMKFSLNMI